MYASLSRHDGTKRHTSRDGAERCECQDVRSPDNRFSVLEAPRLESTIPPTSTAGPCSPICSLPAQESEKCEGVLELASDQLGEALELLDVIEVA